MKRVQLTWLTLCLGGIVLFGLLLENEEAQCRAEHVFLCFDPGSAFAFVAVVGAFQWVVVALILWLANPVYHSWGRRAARSSRTR